MPIRDAVFSGRPLSFSMPVRNISRIEVIRGSGSVVHGSDAVSGIVNIITKTGSELMTNSLNGKGGLASAYIGNFGTYGGSFAYGGKSDEMDYSVSVQAETTKGSDRKINSDAATLIDQTFLASSSNAPGNINQDKTQVHFHYDLGYKDKVRFRLGVRAFEDVGSGVGGSYALSPTDSINNRWINADLDYMGALSPSIKTTTNFSYRVSIQDTEVRNLPLGSPLIPTGMNDTANYVDHQIALKTRANIDSFNNHKVQASLGVTLDFLTNIRHEQDYFIQATPVGLIPIALPGSVPVQSFTEDPLLQRKQRYQVFATFQDEWNVFPDTFLTTGLRVDSYINERTLFSPRAALVHHLSPFLTGKLLYNRSFHMTSFLEEAFSEDSEPELIDMLEFSVEAKDLNANSLTASWYGYKVKNLIIENPTAFQFPAFQSINLRGTGTEIAATYHPLDNVSTKLSYSYTWVIDNREEVYGLTPNHMAFAEINWEFLPTWNLNSQVKWISKRKRAKANDLRKPLNAYTNVILNLSKVIHYSANSDVRINFKVSNLFDADQREPATTLLLPGDIPLPGRSFLGFIELTF